MGLSIHRSNCQLCHKPLQQKQPIMFLARAIFNWRGASFTSARKYALHTDCFEEVCRRAGLVLGLPGIGDSCTIVDSNGKKHDIKILGYLNNNHVSGEDIATGAYLEGQISK